MIPSSQLHGQAVPNVHPYCRSEAGSIDLTHPRKQEATPRLGPSYFGDSLHPRSFLIIKSIRVVTHAYIAVSALALAKTLPRCPAYSSSVYVSGRYIVTRGDVVVQPIYMML